MAFEDVVAKLTGGLESIGDVEAYVAELTAEHTNELEVRQTKIKDLEDNVQSLQEAEKQLKLTNYDLIMKVGTPGEPTPEPKPETGQGVNSLFKPKE